MKIDYNQSLLDFFKSLFRTPSGLLLIGFAFAFLVLGLAPEIPISIFGAKGFLTDAIFARLTFFIMPLVLLSEYLWFSSTAHGLQGELLVSAVLVVTSSIPFIRLL